MANATVVSALQPLLMMYLGSRLLGERVRRAQVGWSLVIITKLARAPEQPSEPIPTPRPDTEATTP